MFVIIIFMLYHAFHGFASGQLDMPCFLVVLDIFTCLGVGWMVGIITINDCVLFQNSTASQCFDFAAW